MTAPDILVVEELDKRYGDTVAVEGVSLAVREGEFVTLLGESGSGKSTVLMAIAGFVTPTAGRIVLRGRDIGAVPPHRRGVGVVFQNYALFPHLSVFENVAYALRNRGVRRAEIAARVGEMLELVRLPGLGHRYPAELSGGQQQRVALARALAPGPDILLLDEPLGALDKNLREHMVVELKTIHRRLGTTMVYVTHDQTEALVMSDRVAVLHRGRLHALASPRELYDQPGTAFLARFIGDANVLPARLAGGVLDIADGLVRVAGLAPPPRAVAAVAIRPERIRLDPDGTCEIGIEGRVADLLYVGERVRCHVTLADGEGVRFHLAAHEHDRFRIGDAVRIGWSRADIRLLSEDDA